MVDYRKATGAASTLIIRDVGGRVSFHIECSSSETWFGSASWSGKVNGTSRNGNFSWAQGTTSKIIAGSWAVETTQDVTFSIGATGTAGMGGPTTFTQRITRPAPNAPSLLMVTRVSDTQHTLAWNRNATYTSVVVQRRTNGGSWQQVGAPTGNASGYTDKTTKANNKYDWRVAGKTAAGTSTWSNTVTAYTTPAVPTGVSATRQGLSIRVDASGKPPHATSYDVRDGSTVVASSVTLPWVHASPDPTVTHQYTVRAKRGDLTSGYSSASNTVQLLTPPNVPSNLAPNGAVRDGAGAVAFSWRHSPVDSSDQEAYELRYRPVDGAWTTLPGGAEQSHSLMLATDDYEWQVRTKGAHPDFSVWSAVATVAVIDAPGVAITLPDGVWQASTVPVEWTYFQAQDRPQSSWEVELLDSSLTVVETRSGQGAATSTVLTTRVGQGEWTIRLRAATGAVWSDWEDAPFEVVFDPPAVPHLDATWDEEQGGVTLDVGPGDDPDLPDTVSLVVERSLDGETWEVVAEVTEATTLIDWESRSFGENRYRVTALTIEGATAIAEAVLFADSPSIWLSGGPGFGITARLPFNPVAQVSAGRALALKQFAGRSKPVAVTGEALSRVVAVSGVTTDRHEGTARVDELTALVQLETPLYLLRDPDGRRIIGSVEQIELSRDAVTGHIDGSNGIWGYSFTLVEAEA